MKRLSSRKLRLGLSLKLWKNDGVVSSYRFQKKSRLLAVAKATSWQKSYLKVFYGKGITNTGKLEDIYNDGEYEELEELKLALSAFTEKSLLDDTEKWIREGSGSI